jgi:hypothetical protein
MSPTRRFFSLTPIEAVKSIPEAIYWNLILPFKQTSLNVYFDGEWLFAVHNMTKLAAKRYKKKFLKSIEARNLAGTDYAVITVEIG